MSAIAIESNKLNPDTYLELFDFDATSIEGTVLYFTNTPTANNTTITWKGNAYYPLPFEISGIGSKGDGSSPNRPTISISNVNTLLLAMVQSMGNLVGMRITRWRTFAKFIDTGSEANSAMHFPKETWIITKKTTHTKFGISFEMSHPADRPGLRLPRELILRDLGYPGVSRIRTR